MVKKDLVTTKLAELAERVARVRAKCPASAAALASDADALDIVSFKLAVQLCADVATHVTSDENWTPARSLAEGFARLEEHGVIGSATAESLKRAVGLRNVVAHGYGHVDAAMVFAAASAGLSDLNDFARDVAKWLTSQP